MVVPSTSSSPTFTSPDSVLLGVPPTVEGATPSPLSLSQTVTIVSAFGKNVSTREIFPMRPSLRTTAWRSFM